MYNEGMGLPHEAKTEHCPIPKATVRKARTEDARAITELLMTVYTAEAKDHQNQTFTAARQEETDTLCDISTNFVFVVEVNNKIVGTITLYDPKKPENKHTGDPAELLNPTTAEFGHFAVLPEFRNGDSGRMLLQRVEQQARELDEVNKLALVTRYEEPSTHLEVYYRSLGFEDIEGGVFTMPHLGFPTIALIKQL